MTTFKKHRSLIRQYILEHLQRASREGVAELFFQQYVPYWRKGISEEWVTRVISGLIKEGVLIEWKQCIEGERLRMVSLSPLARGRSEGIEASQLTVHTPQQ